MSSSSSETRVGSESVCPTEDIEGCDAATCSGNGNEKVPYVDKDLDALLQDYWEEQETVDGGQFEGKPENKCIEWLDKSSSNKNLPSNSKESQPVTNSELPLEVDIPIEKVAALLQDQLMILKNQKYGCTEDLNDGRVPLSPVNQVIDDIKSCLPEALMSIINFVFGKTSEDIYSSQIRQFFYQVLRIATTVESDADGNRIESQPSTTNIQKFKNFGECFDSFEKYFVPFKVALNPRLNKAIVEEITIYVNTRIQESKKNKSPFIYITNEDIYRIIIGTNNKKSLSLAAEKLAKYANRLQKCIWENIMSRCLIFLADMGFDFLKVAQLKESLQFVLSVEEGMQLFMSQESSVDVVHREEQRNDVGEPLTLENIDSNYIEQMIVLNHPEEAELSEPGSQVDSELEFLRGDSQSSTNSFSPAFGEILPRRSPEFDNNSQSPRLNDGGWMEQSIFRFGNSSQESIGSSDGPSMKMPRLQ